MTENRKQILSELNIETQYYSQHTRVQYFKHIGDYLDYIDKVKGDWKDRDTLYKYTVKLRKRGLSQASINYIVRGPIGAIFRSFGLRLPVKLPKAIVGSAMIDFTERVSFTGDEVIEIIKAARATGDSQTQAILMISSIYGARSSEIRAMRKEDIHPKKKTLVIHTLKYGFKREHRIPTLLANTLYGYDFPIISGDYQGNILKRVATEAGVDTRPRKSYHAIRHALINEMRYKAEFSLDVISKFTGWREGGMASQYARPFPFQPEIDDQVFANHPFLAYWEV